MDKRPLSLPGDPALLKQLLADALSRKGQYQSSIATLGTTVTTLGQQNLHQYCRLEQLDDQLRLANQHRFGSSSERHQNQIELQFANEAELLADLPSIPESTATEGRTSTRSPNPVSCPKVCNVSTCTTSSLTKRRSAAVAKLKEIGTETSEQLAIIPQLFHVIRHICHKYACRCERAPRTANKPKQPLPGSDLSASVISWSVVSKHLDGLPLYQEKIAGRQGVEFTRDKLARAPLRVSEQLHSVYNLLVDTWREFDICGCDETALQVLKEKGKAPQSKSSLWIRRGGPSRQPVVLVDYRRNKNKETVEELLDGFSGHLVCDAAACLLNHIEGLRRYCEDGRLPISNIHTEHVAKTIAVARKNYLFADTPSGAAASARVFSIIETARANGHNPHHYLKVLLAELPNAATVETIEALRLWNITPAEVRRRFEAMPQP